MRLDSARELKARLLAEHVGPPGLVSRDASLTGSARRATDAAQPRPTMALGVAPAGRGDYRLAVRVQARALLAPARLDALRDAARGELDVRYVGRVAKQQRQRPWHQARRRPVLVGGSVGHYTITAGTVGAVVRCADGATLLLSNNHVLADENRGRLGDEVLQPGRTDGGRRPQDVVGVLDRFVALEPRAVNRVDCALAELDAEVEADPRTLTGLGALSPSVAPPEEAEAVAKVGRTTGLTRGTVSAFEVDNVVVGFSTGSLRFDDQIELSATGEDPFSQGGDSGSLIVTGDDRRPLGLLFAGSDQGGEGGLGVTFANPLGTVLARLAVELAA